MNKKRIIWIISILVIAVAGYMLMPLLKSKDSDANASVKAKKPLKVDAYVLKTSTLIDEISVYGTLLANDEVELKNEVAGRIVKINLPEGKPVRMGTLLIKLFDDDLQASLRKLQAQLAIQEQIHKRQSELLKVNGISQNDYDQTVLQLNSIKADIEIQKTLIRKTEVLAPFDGVIGLRNVSVGAIVTPSTLLATIRTNNKIKLDFFVPERYGAEIRSGQNVDFTLSNNNTIFTASVLATEQGIEDATRNLKIRAIVNKPSKELISGAFATVNLKLGENHNALMIPSQAIIPGVAGKSVIVAKNGTAHFVKVKTGIRQSAQIEITDGLSIGDTVITTGVMFLKEKNKLLFSTITK